MRHLLAMQMPMPTAGMSASQLKHFATLAEGALDFDLIELLRAPRLETAVVQTCANQDLQLNLTPQKLQSFGKPAAGLKIRLRSGKGFSAQDEFYLRALGLNMANNRCTFTEGLPDPFRTSSIFYEENHRRYLDTLLRHNECFLSHNRVARTMYLDSFREPEHV